MVTVFIGYCFLMKLPVSASVRTWSSTRRISLARVRFDVLRQEFVAEGFADVTGPEGAGGRVEDGEDLGVVRCSGRSGGAAGSRFSEAGDGLQDDREVFEAGLSLPQAAVQFGDLSAKVVGQGPCGFPSRTHPVNRHPPEDILRVSDTPSVPSGCRCSAEPADAPAGSAAAAAGGAGGAGDERRTSFARLVDRRHRSPLAVGTVQQPRGGGHAGQVEEAVDEVDVGER